MAHSVDVARKCVNEIIVDACRQRNADKITDQRAAERIANIAERGFFCTNDPHAKLSLARTQRAYEQRGTRSKSTSDLLS